MSPKPRYFLHSPDTSESPSPPALTRLHVPPEDIMLPPSPPLSPTEEATPSVTSSASSSRPATPRRISSSEHVPSIANSLTAQLTSHTRTRSPSSRSHLRSLSSNAAMTLPLMQRAHSSPGVDSSGRYISPTFATPHRPSSPLGYPGRRHSPLRSVIEDTYLSTPSWSGLNLEPEIPEHAELDMSSPAGGQPSLLSGYSDNEQSSQSLYHYHNTFPRSMTIAYAGSRRRPTSPLHQSASAPMLFTRARDTSTSPSLSASAAQKYVNESYPTSATYSFGSASSMPSTPTSIRSRSPSISSLDTIEDTPDAEEVAEAEAEADAEELANRSRLVLVDEAEGSSDAKRRSSLELRSGALRSNKERKRWSVCGAERRADFSLEVIEE